MSGVMGPKAPAEGWEIRWAKQSFDIALRAPAALAVLIFGIFLSGMSDLFVISMGNIWLSKLFVGTVSVAFGAVIIVAALLVVQKVDGRLEISPAEIIDRMRHAFVRILLVSLAFYAFSEILSHVADAVSSSKTSHNSNSLPDSTLGLSLMLGGVSIVTSMNVAFIIMSLFLAELARSGLRAGAALYMSARLIMMEGMLRMVAIILFTTLLIGMLPYLFQIPMLYLFIIWNYVAAREIFGGIGENKQQESKQARGRMQSAIT